MAWNITKSVQHIVRKLVVGSVIKDVIYSGSLSVTVPSITDLSNGTDVANVDVTVTGVALGDAVLFAAPTVALPTNARFISAVVTATDTVKFSFLSDGGSVTGAAKNFAIVVLDRT